VVHVVDENATEMTQDKRDDGNDSHLNRRTHCISMHSQTPNGDRGLSQAYSSRMSDDPFNALETVYECLKRMESTLLGMKQVRQYVGKGPGKEILDRLIEEAESQLAEIKRKVIQ
jgi:hypothetical protein